MRSTRFVLPFALLFGAAACSSDPQAGVLAPSLGKAGGGGGGSVQDPTATFSLPATGYALRSDGLGDYLNGACTVTSTFFATTASSNTGDVVLNMKAPSGRKCGRLVTLVYPDGVSESLPVSMNLLKLQNTNASTWIPVGGTSARRLIVSPQVVSGAGSGPGRCGRLVFGQNVLDDGTVVAAGTDSLRVTRVDARTWHVQSDPAGSLAYCELQDVNVAMTVDFTVTASRDLPTP